MERLGLIGSPSLETTLGYLRTINREVQKKRGLDHTAEIILFSGNAERLNGLVDAGRWPELTEHLISSARFAAGAGADCLVLCGSALNPMAGEIQRLLGVQVACMGKAMVAKLASFGLKRVGLLGARSEREARMWREHLGGSAVLLPGAADQSRLRRYADLAADADVLPPAWQVETTRIISQLRRAGADAVVLCAPELGRLAGHDEALLP
ncbi:MAG: hypothetical protein HOP00_05310, partial [Nitrospira sp.]|nr:hypothetical protein [Nitrospira sp.]